MKILYRIEALGDISSHLEYIANDNPVAAEEVADRLDQSIKHTPDNA